MSEDTQGVLTKGADVVWKTIRLIIAIGVGTVLLLSGSYKLGLQAAAEVANPINEKIESHLAAVAATKQFMMQFAEDMRTEQRATQRKLNALCQATPKAHCPE